MSFIGVIERCLRGAQQVGRNGNMLVNGLALVVVVRMRTQVGPGQSLRTFVGFESQVALLIFGRALGLAESGIAKHEIVVRFEVFRVNGDRFIQFADGVSVTALQEVDSPQVVVYHAILWVLVQYSLKMLRGLIVFALIAQNGGQEEMRASQVGRNSQRFFEHFFGRGKVAFLSADAAHIHPSIGILRSNFGDFGEGVEGALQITLQKQANSVVVPACPFLGLAVNLRFGLGGVARQNVQVNIIASQLDDRRRRNAFYFPGYIGDVAVEKERGVVVIGRDRGVFLRRIGNAGK